MFWYGDPWLCADYREADILRMERRNQAMWLQGVYIYNAVGVALSNAFSRHSGAKYMEKPVDLFPERTAAREQKNADEEREKIIAYFTQMEKRNQR